MMNFQNSRHQRGAALLVCLIILVLVSLMGLTSMRTALLQEKMSGAGADKALALQGAEMALRSAEERVRVSLSAASRGLFDANAADGLYVARSDGISIADTLDWDTGGVEIYESWRAGQAKPLTDVAQQPRYIIELLFDMKPPLGNSDNIKLKGTPYRITAIGYGKLARTRVVLQSTYYKP